MFEAITDLIVSIPAIIASYFAIKTLQNANEKYRTFIILATTGIIMYSLGEILTFAQIINAMRQVSEALFVIGTISLFFANFTIWWTSTTREKFSVKDILLFGYLIIMTTAFLSYVLFFTAKPEQLQLTLQNFLHAFYPLSSAVLLVQAFLLQRHKITEYAHFFEYYPKAIFFLYFGDMLYTYANYAGRIVPLYFAQGFYFFGYFLFAIAFYLARKRNK